MSGVQNTPADALAETQRVYRPPTVDAPPEEVIEHLLAFDVAKKTFSEIEAALKEAAVEWLGANEELQIELPEGGYLRWYVGTPKTTKAKSVGATVEALLEHAEGDLEVLERALSSNPFKYGEVKNLLGEERFKELFSVGISPKLIDTKTKKPKKGLMVVDTRFLPR